MAVSGRCTTRLAGTRVMKGSSALGLYSPSSRPAPPPSFSSCKNQSKKAFPVRG